MTNAIGAEFPSQPFNLLFVDDQANILKALKRLFRAPDCNIYTAESGAAGLEILRETPIDLIVSDMRMPQMDGAEFLSLAAEQWPETMRILLTGYADLESTVAAVNNGRIYCYCSKPWEDNDFKILVNNALAQKRLRDERQQLFAIIHQQNAELKDLNSQLEGKVAQRTEQLDVALQALQRQYTESIKAFARIIEMRPGIDSGHSVFVAENASNIALRMGLTADEIKDIYYAGLLLQIGKMSLADDLLRQPLYGLSSFEKSRYMRHATGGWELLHGIDPLKNAAELILNQYEHYDGSGEPKALKQAEIPIGARILAVVRDFICYLDGYLTGATMPIDQVKSRLLLHKHKEYDPDVVDVFLALLSERACEERRPIIEISWTQLQAGMKAAEIYCEGELILQNGLISEDLIIQIQEWQKADKGLLIRIRV